MPNKKSHPWCLHPFNNLTIEAEGHFRLCCATSHSFGQIVPDGSIKDVEDFWYNSKEMSDVRKDMLDHNLDGDANLRNICSGCIKQEEQGLHSKRTRYYEQMSKNRPREIMSSVAKPCITNSDLALSRTCNLQCTTCTSYYSSKWFSADRKREELGIIDMFAPEVKSTIGKNALLSKDTIVQLANINSKNSSSAVFKGGEPFLDHNFKFYHQNVRNKNRSTISVVTNGSIYDEELLNLLMEYRSTWLTMSIDGIAPIHCWIRRSTPDEYENMMKIGRYIKNNQNVKVDLNSVISAYNIFTIDKLADWMVDGDHPFVDVQERTFHAIPIRPFESCLFFLRTHKNEILDKVYYAANKFSSSSTEYKHLISAAKYLETAYNDLSKNQRTELLKIKYFLINYDQILVPERGDLSKHDTLFGEALLEMRKYFEKNKHIIKEK